MWVPSHFGLAGNLAVDIAAKAALLLPVSNVTVPYSEFELQLTHLYSGTKTIMMEFWNWEHATKPRVNVISLFHLTHQY